MNRNILNQAFISMGYRQMSEYTSGNIYGKPIGFGIIIAKINKNHKEIEFKSLFRNFNTAETMTWDSKDINIDFTDPNTGYETIEGKDLYERYIREIANAEYKVHASKVIYAGNCIDKGTFAFVTNLDKAGFFNF